MNRYRSNDLSVQTEIFPPENIKNIGLYTKYTQRYIADMTLFCYVLGSPVSSSIPVDISDPTKVDNVDIPIKNLTFGHIKKLIWPNNNKASELKLWKVEISREEKKEKLDALNKYFRENVDMADVLGEELDATDPFPVDYKPPPKTIHIIVQPPSSTTTDLERKGKEAQDISDKILENLRKRPTLTLPGIEFLSDFLDSALSEDFKIPVTQDQFNMLKSHNISDPCNQEDLEILFRVSDTENATELCSSLIFPPILYFKMPPDDGSENSFIGFWDACIRNPLDMLIPNGESIRNSSKCTSTNDDRPDYAFILGNVCPFRGEEKSSKNTEDPKIELGRKLVWTYDPAPYILGYYAKGPQVTIAAICQPSANCATPHVVDIVHSNLKFRKDRVRILLRLFNLSCIIDSLNPVIARSGLPEFKQIHRDNRTIEIRGAGVKKKYLNDKQNRVQKLVNIYEKLKEKGVPNTDRLDCFDKEGGVVHLSPKGLHVTPKNQRELLEAIICVLEALVILHDPNDPIYHRDIRWDNIMRSYQDRSKWFLIDWDDATGYPNSEASHLSIKEHAREVFQENHRGEVDMWSVGKLIKHASKWSINLSKEIIEYGNLLLSANKYMRPSPESALRTFKDIYGNL